MDCFGLHQTTWDVHGRYLHSVPRSDDRRPPLEELPSCYNPFYNNGYPLSTAVALQTQALLRSWVIGSKKKCFSNALGYTLVVLEML